MYIWILKWNRKERRGEKEVDILRIKIHLKTEWPESSKVDEKNQPIDPEWPKSSKVDEKYQPIDPRSSANPKQAGQSYGKPHLDTS